MCDLEFFVCLVSCNGLLLVLTLSEQRGPELGMGSDLLHCQHSQPGSSENVNCFQLGMFHHTDCRSQRMLQYVLTAAFLVFQPFNISETDQITQDCAQSVQCGLMLNILSILLTKIYMLHYNSGQLVETETISSDHCYWSHVGDDWSCCC